MKYVEVEFKYRAEDAVSLSKFMGFCEAVASDKPPKFIMASGWDYFYQSPKDEAGFYRLRVGSDMFQLTYKQKTSAKNSFVRHEDNLDIARSKTSKGQIEAHVARHGYEYNTTIFKNCFIYKYDYYTLVYYICYDLEMKELGRFIEIEMSEDYGWKSEDEAWAALTTMEKLCKPLGLSAQGRVKKSLYELFRQEK